MARGRFVCHVHRLRWHGVVSPAPGGGSVAAYARAQGYALVAMVCRLTLGREKFFSVQEEIRSLLEVAVARQEELLGLVQEDCTTTLKIKKSILWGISSMIRTL